MSSIESYAENPPDQEDITILRLVQGAGLPRPVQVQLESQEVARQFFPEDTEPPLQTAASNYATRIFLWDTEIIAEVMAKLGSKKIVDWAAYSLLLLVKKQRPDGFISNMQYLDHNEGLSIGGKAERLSFTSKEGSDYSQPALLPTAIKAVAEGYDRLGEEDIAWEFRKQIHASGRDHIFYFRDYRASSPDNPLVFNNHVHEDGRDSSGAGKLKLPRWGDNTPQWWDNLDAAQDIALTAIQSIRLKLAGWDLDKAKKIYGRRDVMFNSIIAKNAIIMSDLSKMLAEHYPEDSNEYKQDAMGLDEYGQRLEDAIYDHMWFKDKTWSPKTRTHKGAFYSLKGNGKPQRKIDIGDLMTNGLPNLRAEHLVANLNLMLTSYNTRYGLPSAPKDSPSYDPENKRKTGCNWDGSGWPHMDTFAADDLRMQANRIESEPEFRDQFKRELEAEQCKFLCNLVGDMLAGNAKELTKDVYAEQYDPETGEAQRYPEVSNFGMAMRADIVPYFGLAENDIYFNLCQRLGRVVNIVSV